jgi:hypothetical protein
MEEKFKYALGKTKIIRSANRNLYTFSSTAIRYTIATELTDKILVEVRDGELTAERPVIITPSHFTENYLEGFEHEQAEYIEMMLKKLGLRGLRYKYKNETKNVKLVSGSFQNIVEKIKREIEAKDDDFAAIIKGVPDMWGISLMKYVVELISKSFPDNIRELEERGWFSY